MVINASMRNRFGVNAIESDEFRGIAERKNPGLFDSFAK
jgi:hypothetical protein